MKYSSILTILALSFELCGSLGFLIWWLFNAFEFNNVGYFKPAHCAQASSGWCTGGCWFTVAYCTANQHPPVHHEGWMDGNSLILLSIQFCCFLVA